MSAIRLVKRDEKLTVILDERLAIGLHAGSGRTSQPSLQLTVQDTTPQSIRLMGTRCIGEETAHGNPLVEDRVDHSHRDNGTEDNRCDLATHF